MDMYEYGELIKKLIIKIENIKNILKPEEIKERLSVIRDAARS